MTQKIVLLSACILAVSSVILGAFGAHALKKVLETHQLNSFETALKYQMYHALALLFVGMFFSMETLLQKSMALCFIIGICLFSFSIYGLVLSNRLSLLGPLTPIGGTFLIVAWILMIICILKKF